MVSIQERRQAWKIKIYFGVGLAVSCYKHGLATLNTSLEGKFCFSENSPIYIYNYSNFKHCFSIAHNKNMININHIIFEWGP